MEWGYHTMKESPRALRLKSSVTNQKPEADLGPERTGARKLILGKSGILELIELIARFVIRPI